MPNLYYLASPYSHETLRRRLERFDAACGVTAMLIRAGLTVYSPIAHSHQVAVYGAIHPHDPCWYDQSMALLERCDALIVLPLDGWEQSRGVAAEIDAAERDGKPVFVYPDPRTSDELRALCAEWEREVNRWREAVPGRASARLIEE